MPFIDKATQRAIVTTGAILLTGGIAAPIAAGLIARNFLRGLAEDSSNKHNPSGQPESKNQGVNPLDVG